MPPKPIFNIYTMIGDPLHRRKTQGNATSIRDVQRRSLTPKTLTPTSANSIQSYRIPAHCTQIGPTHHEQQKTAVTALAHDNGNRRARGAEPHTRRAPSARRDGPPNHLRRA